MVGTVPSSGKCSASSGDKPKMTASSFDMAKVTVAITTQFTNSPS